MGYPAHDAGLKVQALTIAKASTIGEASKQTGIPEGTIKRWRLEARRGKESKAENRIKPIDEKPKPPGLNLQYLQREAVQKAVDQAGDYLAERLKGMADDLYALAAKAIRKVDLAISDSAELPKDTVLVPRDRGGAAWVRALVGVMAQSIEKGQLLAGRPTARSEEQRTTTVREEYRVQVEHVLNDPQRREAVRDLWREAHERAP